jgi:predicted transcriptional regulator
MRYRTGRPAKNIDILLLEKLLANKYITITEIAVRLNVNRNTIYYRIKNCEKLREQALLGNRFMKKKKENGNVKK